MLADALRERGLALDATQLVWAGRWLTPPFAPLRFDNRFFLLHWPAERADQPTVVPGELAEGEWVEPTAALVRWHSGEVLAANVSDGGVDCRRHNNNNRLDTRTIQNWISETIWQQSPTR